MTMEKNKYFERPESVPGSQSLYCKQKLQNTALFEFRPQPETRRHPSGGPCTPCSNFSESSWPSPS